MILQACILILYGLEGEREEMVQAVSDETQIVFQSSLDSVWDEKE